MDIQITSLKIKSVKEVAEYFASQVENIETEDDRTSEFEFTHQLRPTLELDFKGKFSREYDYDNGDYFNPPTQTISSQNVWNADLIGFIDGEEIGIENADEICEIIEKLVNKN